MGAVWLYVTISVVLIWAVMYSWHLWEVRNAANAQAQRSANVEKSITALTEYRDALRSGGEAAGDAYISARLHATTTAR